MSGIKERRRRIRLFTALVPLLMISGLAVIAGIIYLGIGTTAKIILPQGGTFHDNNR